MSTAIAAEMPGSMIVRPTDLNRSTQHAEAGAPERLCVRFSREVETDIVNRRRLFVRLAMVMSVPRIRCDVFVTPVEH